MAAGVIAQTALEALVNALDNDTERVLALDNSLDPKFRNVSPEIDSIIDGLDNWLIVHRWMPRLREQLHGKERIVADDGTVYEIDYDDEDWGEY